MIRLTAREISDTEREALAIVRDEDLRRNRTWARRFLSALTQAMLAAKEEVL